MRPRGRSVLARAAVAAGVLALLPVLSAVPAAAIPADPAGHGGGGGGGGPSAAQVAAGKARVARLERKVAAAAADVARSQAALDRARTAAEVAVEAYDKAQVVEADAGRSLSAAQVVLAAAAARVGVARSDVSKFAVAAYEGGALSSLDVVLSSQGPDSMLYRLGALAAVSRSQRDVLLTFDAALDYQHAVQETAATVLAQARRATSTAAAARVRAGQLVSDATAGVQRLGAAQQRLAAMLRDARAHVGVLERERLAALARARAQAEAARRAAAQKAAQQAAQQAGSASSQPVSGTVSASTEQAALQAAASQLGKPYEWGAAGPDTYDCSGLVMWAYGQVGVQVDHWTGDQWNEGAHISVAEIRPGDLLFFATDTSDPNTIHHVGMYAGNGQMIEAPYTGANVRYSDAFRPDLIGVVRLFNR